MKRNDWAILAAAVLYSFLFYRQNAGINFFLFSLVMVLLSAWTGKKLITNRMWQVSAALTLFSASFVLIHGSSLALLANIVSLMLLSASAVSPQSSALSNLLHTIFSIGGSPAFIVTAVSSRNNQPGAPKTAIRVLTLAIPVVLALLFFFVYKNANPLFEKFTEKINLNFISLPWFFFTLSGLLVAYGFIAGKRIVDLDKWENEQGEMEFKSGSSTLWRPDTAFTILMVLLNLMLVMINVLDVNYLYLGAGMPEGLTHKQFVHNGVHMLILSIVMGMICIVFFIKRIEPGKSRTLANRLIFLWVLQNLMMVVSTGFRNHLYIHEALLTYKRIGVYYWLVFAGLGLMTLMLMIRNNRSAWQLIRVNSFLAAVILVFSSAADWDKNISCYNLGKIKYMASLDKKYMISLSEGNLPLLYRIKNDPDFNTDSVYHYQSQLKYLNTTALDGKLYDFMKKNQEGDWRSFNIRRDRVKTEMMTLALTGKLSQLDLSGKKINSLAPVQFVKDLKTLHLPASMEFSQQLCNELNSFKDLETLHLDRVRTIDILYLKKLNVKKLVCANTSPVVLNQMRQALQMEVLVAVK